MIDSVLDAAIAYTREELSQYVRLADMDAVINESRENRARINWLEDQSATIAATVDAIRPDIAISPSFIDKIRHMEEEIGQIKDVLMDIQMTLRMQGLDDMSKRIGDLDMLLL